MRRKSEVKKMTEREKWLQYEAEKSRLKSMNLTQKEYEAEIDKICERLNL
jgi:hypothetical protein